ncbi:MAG: lasso peptide biosynthesis B2 protein [Acidimicrobiia bacterium]
MRAGLDLPTLAAAWWTVRVLHRLRRDLRRRPLTELILPAPPRLAPASIRGVLGVLRRRPHTCLQRALILQRWMAAQGDDRDVVIGVNSPREQFRAHAWVDGEPSCHQEVYRELVRLPAR